MYVEKNSFVNGGIVSLSGPLNTGCSTNVAIYIFANVLYYLTKHI